MATIQQQIDALAGRGGSAVNLTLSGLGAAQMALGKKDVKITTNDKDNPRELLVSSAQSKVGFASEAVGLNSVIMYADVTEQARVFEHPLEDGTVIADHEIQQPVEIKLQLVMPYYLYGDIVEELRALKENGTFVTVHTKGGIYTDMLFVSIPHKESVENVDRLSFDCTLRQAFLVKGEDVSLQVKDVKIASNADTANTGTKKGKELSVLSDIIKSAKAAIGNLRG